MPTSSGIEPARRWRAAQEFVVVMLSYTALMGAMTYPWIFHIARAGRIDSSDGQFSIWNVSWVARMLVVNPLEVLNANIFYPVRGTLAFSEMNLGAGLLAVPAYWISANPILAHNTAMLLAFVLAGTCTYYLARYLTGDRRAAAVTGICYAFCPFVFARTTQIQLMMTFGLPLSMLAFHRWADKPSVSRGAGMGAAVGVQTLFCAYYGVFAALMMVFSVGVVTVTRRRWLDARHWWTAVAGAGAAALIVLPLYAPYLTLQETVGFSRSLDDTRRFSAGWRSYLASPAVAHRWLHPLLGGWREVAFPGFLPILLAGGGAVAAWRTARQREFLLLYGGMVVLAVWASTGPDGGLYMVLHDWVPGFGLMRAPGRFGLVVALGLTVLAGFGIRDLSHRIGRPVLASLVLAAALAVELAVPLGFPDVPPADAAHRDLADQPPGPVVALPFFNRHGFRPNTEYMLHSTWHWMPLVNGFSDYIPEEFVSRAQVLRQFPSPDAIRLLRNLGVRYAILHMKDYDPAVLPGIVLQLRNADADLRPIRIGPAIRIYEIRDQPVDLAALPSPGSGLQPRP